jgi:hypothetical protein
VRQWQEFLSIMTNFPVLLSRPNDYRTVLCTHDFKNTLLEAYICSLYSFLIWFLKTYQGAMFEDIIHVLNRRKVIIFFQNSKGEDQQYFENLMLDCQKTDANCKLFGTWYSKIKALLSISRLNCTLPYLLSIV